MFHRISPVLFTLCVALPVASAQTGVLDQTSPAGNASFNGDAISLVWQQEVQAGLTGLLEGFSITVTGNVGSQLNVAIRLGPGWNTSPAVYGALLTKTSAATEVLWVDCSTAGISVAPGTTFVIEMFGNATGTWIQGSYVSPPGTPLYAPLLYLGGPGCFADCGWRLGFDTYVQVTPPPATFCAAKLNSLGCMPSIAFAGSPSATATNGFTISASQVRNQKPGLLLYTNMGRGTAAFQSGTLCVLSPIRRSIPLNSGGSALPASDCSGQYSVDMNAFSHSVLGGNPKPYLLVPGTVVQCQFWGTDPGFPSPNNSTLSNGLEYVVP